MYLLIILLTISTLGSSQNSQTPVCKIGCAQCDSISAVCFACGSGYELTLQGQCVLASIPQCSLYLNEKQCTQCVPTNSLINNACQRDFSRCIQNISSSRCGRCLPELINDKGNCVGVINCEIYSGKSCVKCASGFILRGNICAAVTDNCYVLDQPTGICRICAPGYAIVGYKCISTTITVENCYLYDEKGSCYVCKRGYIINGPRCSLQYQLGNVQFQIVKPPALIPPSNQANPAQGYPSGLPISLISKNNVVQANSKAVRVAENIYCSKLQNGTCIQCYISYYLQNGTCVQVDTLCQKFNYKTTKCQGCYLGYVLNSNLVCVIQKDPLCRVFNKDNKCTECYSSYFLNSNGICQTANTFCKEINTDGSCKSCYDGYELTGKNCVISQKNNTSNTDPFCLKIVDNKCTTCANGYYVSNTTGRCIPLNSNCLVTDNVTGLCTKCLGSLLLFNGTCIYPIENCAKYSSNQTCIECSSGYQLKNGICNNKDLTCAEYDSVGKCTKCIVTYYLVKGKCIFPTFGFDPSCTDYIGGFCSACKVGSYIVNYICQSIDKNCISFNYQKSICQRCILGLIPQGAICV